MTCTLSGWPRYFYPRPPRGGRHLANAGSQASAKFLSTPSARRATNPRDFLEDFCIISIHALREEGDLACLALLGKAGYFYPRPPRGGRPVAPQTFLFARKNFYPRPPRGGRPSAASASTSAYCISIHALREEGDFELVSTSLVEIISIHALREEGDCFSKHGFSSLFDFYPRPPRGGRPLAVKNSCVHEAISIHALREEGDGTFNLVHAAERSYFYPRPPRGGRLFQA